jgi:hypothetical protein
MHRCRSKTRNGSLLAYRAIEACLRERCSGQRDIGEKDTKERDIRESDIGESDNGVRDIGEMDIGETVATYSFHQQLLINIHIHIHIRGVSGCLGLSQSWHVQARFLRRHKPQMLQPTEGMSLRRSWS